MRFTSWILRFTPTNDTKIKAKNLKIYTIGIGSDQAFRVVQDFFGTYKIPIKQDLDEQLLKAVAEKTGGFYGRADDAQALRKIVKQIDELETSEVKAYQYTQFAENFDQWAFPALIILALEILARCTIFRKIP